MKRILIVFGTRPESLKVYPIIYYAKDFPNLEVESYFTNQHERQYIEFEPHYSAEDICGTRLAKNIGQVYSDLDWFMEGKQYNYILVQGDTYSALAGAMWGYYNQISVAHVEAGLRTFRKNPFPEEKNRIMIDVLSQVRFCPTRENRFTVSNEDYKYRNDKTPDRYDEEKINLITGNTIIDRLKMELDKGIVGKDCSKPYYVCTLHRRESWNGFKEMLDAFKLVAQEFKDKHFFFIANPNKKLNEFFDPIENMSMEEPQNYRDMVGLLYGCEAVLTDSGGLVEESAYLKKPCYILRDETEREEAMKVGLAKLVGRKNIVRLTQYMKDHSWFDGRASFPFGDGNSSIRILKFLDTGRAYD